MGAAWARTRAQGRQLTLDALNAALKERGCRHVLQRIEPWSAEIEKRGYLMVRCQAQPERITAHFREESAEARTASAGNETANGYNNCLIFTTDLLEPRSHQSHAFGGGRFAPQGPGPARALSDGPLILKWQW